MKYNYLLIIFGGIIIACASCGIDPTTDYNGDISTPVVLAGGGTVPRALNNAQVRVANLVAKITEKAATVQAQIENGQIRDVAAAKAGLDRAKRTIIRYLTILSGNIYNAKTIGVLNENK